MVYAPQISDDGQQFPNFDGLSAKWDTAAEYIALFPNVLLGVHRDHYFAIILTPDEQMADDKIHSNFQQPVSSYNQA